MFERIKRIILYRDIKNRLEKEGFCVWPIKKDKDKTIGATSPDIGVTLPDVNTKEDGDKVLKTLEEITNKTAELHKAKISMEGPYFSAGGVYASYLSVKYS